MKAQSDNIDKFIPFGELIRGFVNQPYLSNSDLKVFLRKRGIFTREWNKTDTVPIIANLLISPSEFDDLKDLQNTREDNTKKNTSRLDWNSNEDLTVILDGFNFKDVIPNEGVNYWFKQEPQIRVINEREDKKILMEFEIERKDLNKSWYESKNIFQGQIEIEKTTENEIKITKSFTSNESKSAANGIQKKLVEFFKKKGCVKQESKLKKILFGDFTNEERVVFFYRLSAHMEDERVFNFKDIVNMEFRPDEKFSLPEEIKWMKNKSELMLKGKEIHDTFFIKEKEYHKNLEFWEMESSYSFEYKGYKGSCNLILSFNNFLKDNKKAEFEINISQFRLKDSSEYTARDKTSIRNELLNIFEQRKDHTYRKFMEYLKEKNAAA